MATQSAVSQGGLEIPLIDFSKFLHGTPDERQSTAEALLHGFQTAGFVYLDKPPITPASIQRALRHARAFFAQPAAALEPLKWTTADANRGYTAVQAEMIRPPGAHSSSRGFMSDLKETYHMGSEADSRFANLWPDEGEGTGLAGFRADMVHFYQQCSELNLHVMRALCLALAISPTSTDAAVVPGNNILRLLHYPAVEARALEDTPEGQRGVAHTVRRQQAE